MKRRNFQPIGAVISEFLKDSNIDVRLNETKALQAWKDILGPSVERCTRELYVRNGVLYAHLTSAVLRHELQMSRSNLISRINQHLGIEIIKDIVFR
ncbi:MAG: DUF721 domain-containing protein [Bacteroidales bacterium]